MVYWYHDQLIDSEQITLNLSNPGLIYGATLFTTLRVYQQDLDHPLTHWPDHINRLRSSLAIADWPFTRWDGLRKGAERLAQIYPILRMVIFPDGKEWITGRFLKDNLIEKQQEGIKGWVAHDALFSRSLATHKTGNYLGAWLGLKKAQQLGAEEGILVDHQGNWLETCTGNLWGWQEGCWYLPPEGQILSGIMRSHLLTWLKQQSLPVQEIPWTPSFVAQLDIIAYSNCGVEMIPFRQISDQNQVKNYNPYHPALEDVRGYFQENGIN